MATVRVDAVVGWTPPRPDDEFVPASDHVVVVSVVRSNGSIGRRVVVTDSQQVGQIVHSFNELAVSQGGAHSCPPIPLTAVAYRIAFFESRTAHPDVVATLRSCAGVAVVAGGKASVGLEPSEGLGDAIAHVLGRSELRFY